MNRIMLYAIALFVLWGCSTADRSLIFVTSTSFGVDIAVGDSTSTSPIKLQLGYKRHEGVLNPVYDKNGLATAGGEKYRDEAYSVLAKITGSSSSKATSSVGSSISGAQWFATGEAAKELSKQPGITGAITGSAEIAKASALAYREDRLLPTEAVLILESAYTALNKLAQNNNADARTLRDDLDKLAVTYQPIQTGYYSSVGGAADTVQLGTQSTVGTIWTFQAVVNHVFASQTSRNKLASAVAHVKANAPHQLKVNDSSGTLIATLSRAQAEAELARVIADLATLEKALLRQEAVQDALRFFFRK